MCGVTMVAGRERQMCVLLPWLPEGAAVVCVVNMAISKDL